MIPLRIEGSLGKRDEGSVHHDLHMLKTGAGRDRRGVIDRTNELVDDAIVQDVYDMKNQFRQEEVGTIQVDREVSQGRVLASMLCGEGGVTFRFV
jgi:hypothetical protein